MSKKYERKGRNTTTKHKVSTKVKSEKILKPC